MKKNHYLIPIALILSGPVVAKDYYLQSNETISDLLFHRLKFKKIYGENGILQKVLIDNKLTLKKSKSLPIGYPIFIQTEGPEKTQPPVVEEAPVVSPDPETVPPQILNRTFTVDGGIYNLQLQGESDTSSFKASTIVPTAGATFSQESEKFILRGLWDISYLKFEDTISNRGKTSFVTSSLEGAFLKNQKAFNLGFMANFKSEVFINSANGDTYKMINPWFYSLGPQFEFKNEASLYTFKLEYSPAQTIGSNIKTKSNFSGNFIFTRNWSENLKVDFDFETGQRNTNVNDTSFYKLGVNLKHKY